MQTNTPEDSRTTSVAGILDITDNHASLHVDGYLAGRSRHPAPPQPAPQG
jgi:transcription termination factor Rho